MLIMVGHCRQGNIIYKCTKLHDHSSNRQDAREAMRVFFFCTYKTYLHAQNKFVYEYIQILF